MTDAGLIAMACILFLSQTPMALRAATVHETDAPDERLCPLSRLSQFGQLKGSIDFID
jgi:hypothetical protein